MQIKSFELLIFLSITLLGCRTQEDSAGTLHQSGHHTSSSSPDAASGAKAQINKTPPPGPAPEGMVWVPGGSFWMGCEDCEMPDALPMHLVTVDGFWMDATPVTNAQF